MNYLFNPRFEQQKWLSLIFFFFEHWGLTQASREIIMLADNYLIIVTTTLLQVSSSTSALH